MITRTATNPIRSLREWSGEGYNPVIVATGLKSTNQLRTVLILSIIILLSFLFFLRVSPANHWREIFRPAALALLSGQSPYKINDVNGAGFYNPPWILLPIIPLAFLPEYIGEAILREASLIIFFAVGYKLGAKPLQLALFLLSPHVLHLSYNVNLESLVALGFILPPQFGLFLVLAKPQIGLAVAVYWLFQSWKVGKLREVARVFAPVVLAFSLSVILFGPYFMNGAERLDVPHNEAPWPYLIPLGLALLARAIKNNNKGEAIVASPLLSPYVLTTSWPVAILGLLPDNLLFFLATIGLWLIWLFTGWPAPYLFTYK